MKAPEVGSAEILGMDAAKHRRQVFGRVGVQLQNTQYQPNITVEEACIEENGYEIAGEIRESYIDGVWNKDDAREWLSEIQVPVRKKAEVVLA